jgi:hypothetical protein
MSCILSHTQACKHKLCLTVSLYFTNMNISNVGSELRTKCSFSAPANTLWLTLQITLQSCFFPPFFRCKCVCLILRNISETWFGLGTSEYNFPEHKNLCLCYCLCSCCLSTALSKKLAACISYFMEPDTEVPGYPRIDTGSIYYMQIGIYVPEFPNLYSAEPLGSIQWEDR